MVVEVGFVEEDNVGHSSLDNREFVCLVLVQLLQDSVDPLIQKNILKAFPLLYLEVNNLQLVCML